MPGSGDDAGLYDEEGQEDFDLDIEVAPEYGHQAVTDRDFWLNLWADEEVLNVQLNLLGDPLTVDGFSEDMRANLRSIALAIRKAGLLQPEDWEAEEVIVEGNTVTGDKRKARQAKRAVKRAKKSIEGKQTAGKAQSKWSNIMSLDRNSIDEQPKEYNFWLDHPDKFFSGSNIDINLTSDRDAAAVQTNLLSLYDSANKLSSRMASDVVRRRVIVLLFAIKLGPNIESQRSADASLHEVADQIAAADKYKVVSSKNALTMELRRMRREGRRYLKLSETFGKGWIFYLLFMRESFILRSFPLEDNLLGLPFAHLKSLDFAQIVEDSGANDLATRIIDGLLQQLEGPQVEMMRS